MSIDVVIVDYGMGNLFSVRRAFEYCGARVVMTDDPHIIRSAPRLVLPGVGAFKVGMSGLVERGLDFLMHEFADSGKPLLGICLGMQMLVNLSQEFGEHAGLGIIPGQVVPVPPTTIDNKKHKIPHIGWTELSKSDKKKSWDNSILATIKPGDAVYLVHSYAVSTSEDYCLAHCDYNGRMISAVIRKQNVYGTQFHPEKSGIVGLKILRSFLSI